MSWHPLNSSTDPSRWTLTCALTSSRANTYQLPFATPIPRFFFERGDIASCPPEPPRRRAGVNPSRRRARWPVTSGPQLPVDMSPAFLLRRSQPMAFAPGSYCARRTGLDSFFFRNSSGSIPSFSAISSTADSMPKAPCEWPGARSGAAGPAFVKTSYSSPL